MTLDTLIGLGGSHLHNVRELVSERLEEFAPDIITLEASIGTTTLGIGKMVHGNVTVHVPYSTHSAPKIAHGRKKLIRVGLLDDRKAVYNIDGQEFASLYMDDAANAAFEFGLKKELPVFFIDNPFQDGKTIIGIRKTNADGNLSGEVVYCPLTLPPPTEELAPATTDRGFDKRNKFIAHAILILSEYCGANKVAHAGGIGHFRRDYRTETASILHYSQTTIQDLVKPRNFHLYGMSGIVKVL